MTIRNPHQKDEVLSILKKNPLTVAFHLAHVNILL